MRSPLLLLSALAIFTSPACSAPTPVPWNKWPWHQKGDPAHQGWRPKNTHFGGSLTDDHKYDKNHKHHWIGNDSYMNTERITEENSGHFNSGYARGSKAWYKDEFIRDHAPPQRAGAQHKNKKRDWKVLPVENVVLDMNTIPCQTQKYAYVTATTTTIKYVPTATIYITSTSPAAPMATGAGGQ